MSIGGPKTKQRGQGPKGGNAGGNGKKQGNGKGGGGNSKPTPPPWYTAPPTRGQAVKQSWEETRPEYLPLKRQEQGEIRASEQRTKDLGGWWNEYLQTVAAGQTATQDAYDKAAADGQAFIGQANAADNANTAKLDATAADSAALRGQAPSAQPAERAAAAQAQRNALSAAMGGATATRGANQYAYLGEQKRIGAGQSIAARRQEQARTRSKEQDLLATKKEQGAQAVKNFGGLRKTYLENHLKEQAFGLERKKTKADIAAQLAEQEREERKERADRRQQEIENENETTKIGQSARQIRIEEEEAKKKGKSGGLTTGEKHDIKAGKENAYATVRFLFNKHKWKDWEALERAVAKESEVSPAEARWAVQKYREHEEAREAERSRKEHQGKL